MKIFIAGPYSKPDPVENTRIAILAAEEVIKRGHTPYVPHLTLLWHLVAPHKLEWWYQYDRIWLRFCNAVLRLEGLSTGADIEVDIARQMGIPVYFTIEDIPKGYDYGQG